MGHNKSTMSPLIKVDTFQEDSQSVHAREVVQKAFNDQEQQIQTMSFKSHAVDCDIVSCIKDICFIHEPDKIVKKSVVKRKSDDQRSKETQEKAKLHKERMLKLRYGLLEEKE